MKKETSGTSAEKADDPKEEKEGEDECLSCMGILVYSHRLQALDMAPVCIGYTGKPVKSKDEHSGRAKERNRVKRPQVDAAADQTAQAYANGKMGASFLHIMIGYSRFYSSPSRKIPVQEYGIGFLRPGMPQSTERGSKQAAAQAGKKVPQGLPQLPARPTAEAQHATREKGGEKAPHHISPNTSPIVPFSQSLVDYTIHTLKFIRQYTAEGFEGYGAKCVRQAKKIGHEATTLPGEAWDFSKKFFFDEGKK
ncbi:unnamed protein product [Chrysoparadoxa australica]